LIGIDPIFENYYPEFWMDESMKDKNIHPEILMQ